MRYNFAFRKVNSGTSEYQRQFDRIVDTWLSCSRGRWPLVRRSSKGLCFFIGW
jgi:hypothetical protein